MAKTKDSTGAVEVRLLITCAHGGCNDVVALDADTAASAVAAGHADDSAEAVAYAKSLVADTED